MVVIDVPSLVYYHGCSSRLRQMCLRSVQRRLRRRRDEHSRPAGVLLCCCGAGGGGEQRVRGEERRKMAYAGEKGVG